MLELAYVSQVVLQKACMIDTAGQCTHKVLADLEYPCPNNEVWVNDLGQLDNLTAQWKAANCDSCFPGTCANKTFPPLTVGECVKITILTPAGPQSHNECKNQ
jgi:hypothetical protein